jgi:hypothetical protein
MPCPSNQAERVARQVRAVLRQSPLRSFAVRWDKLSAWSTSSSRIHGLCDVSSSGGLALVANRDIVCFHTRHANQINQALSTAETLYGPLHENTLSSRFNLGTVYEISGTQTRSVDASFSHLADE